MGKPVIFLSTAEFSGDQYGAELIGELRRLLPQAEFYGLGGPQMAAAGMDLLYHTTARSSIGFVEVIKNLSKVRRLLDQTQAAWRQRPPALVLWIDSGGFNLLLAQAAQQQGIPVVCIFSPSAWAYGEDRAVKLAQRVKLLLAVLPFEADFYRRYGTKVSYVGHPLLDRVQSTISAAVYRRRLGIKPEERLVALLPGSRRQEIKRLLGVMLQAAQRLDQSHRIRWVLPVAASLDRAWLERLLRHYPVQVELVQQSGTYDLLAAADAAVIASGTATLEAALLATPMVVVYRVSPLSILVYRMLESRHHKDRFQTWLVALPNIISGRRIVPELIQRHLTPSRLAAELGRLLDEPAYQQQMRQELQQLRQGLGPTGVMARAAGLIVELLGQEKQ